MQINNAAIRVGEAIRLKLHDTVRLLAIEEDALVVLDGQERIRVALPKLR